MANVIDDFKNLIEFELLLIPTTVRYVDDSRLVIPASSWPTDKSYFYIFFWSNGDGSSKTLNIMNNTQNTLAYIFAYKNEIMTGTVRNRTDTQSFSNADMIGIFFAMYPAP